MNDYELTWYMQEISMHGLGAEIDFKHFLQAVKNEETRQTRTVWFHLTSFLSHAAMISKLVSPILRIIQKYYQEMQEIMWSTSMRE